MNTQQPPRADEVQSGTSVVRVGNDVWYPRELLEEGHESRRFHRVKHKLRRRAHLTFVVDGALAKLRVFLLETLDTRKAAVSCNDRFWVFGLDGRDN